MQKMRVLFISRAYPPVVGGIENQNYELSVWLSKLVDLKMIVNRYGRGFLFIFAPYSFIRSLFCLHLYDVVLLGDGNLAIVGWFIKIFSKKPVICVIHGLDINYGSISIGLWYEKIIIFLHRKLWVGFFIRKLDKLIAVGNETKQIAIQKGISEEKIIFIPNGVDVMKYLGNYSRVDLEKMLGESLGTKKIILTSGRLIKRKGVAWFIRNVLPKLPENILYIVVGDGPDKINIENAIEGLNLQERVRMTGYVIDEIRNVFLNTADLFIQPNIKVEGDIEGFGLSVIEASSCGLPVIASRIEGLQDAIKDFKNGFLLPPGEPQCFVDKIIDLLSDEIYRKEFGQKARQFTIDYYNWEIIAKKYLDEIEKVVSMSV